MELCILMDQVLAFAQGKSQTFTFTPSTGYEVDEVKVNGNVVVVTGNSHTVTNVQGNVAISVTFKAIPIDYSWLTLPALEIIPEGNNLKVRIVGPQAETFISLSADGVNYSPVNGTFTVPKGVKHLKATSSSGGKIEKTIK